MKIKNSMYKNLFGERNQKEFTTDNGKTYIVKNTPYKNLFGGGYQQEISEKPDTSFFMELPPLGLICVLLFLISLIPLLLAVASLEPVRIMISILISAGLGICFMLATFGRRGIYSDIFIISLQIIGMLLLTFGAIIGSFAGLISLVNFFCGV